MHVALQVFWDEQAAQCSQFYFLLVQVLQIFMPIISTSPLANLLTSKFGSIFGQGLVGLQNLIAGMA